MPTDINVIKRRRANPEAMKLYDYGQRTWRAAPKQDEWRTMVDAALQTERRLIVERIRTELLPPTIDSGSPSWQAIVRDALDAEAQR